MKKLEIENNLFVKEVIENLLAKIDFMGHQLSFAKNILDEEQFTAIENEFFSAVKKPNKDFEKKIEILVSILGDKIDTDIVSMALYCDYENASIGLSSVAAKISSDYDKSNSTSLEDL